MPPTTGNGEKALGHWLYQNAAVVLLLISWIVGGAVMATRLAAADEALSVYGRENRRRIEQCEIEAKEQRAARERMLEDLAALRTQAGIPRREEK